MPSQSGTGEWKAESLSPERAALNSVGQGAYSPRRPTFGCTPLKPCRGDIKNPFVWMSPPQGVALHCLMAPLQGAFMGIRYVGRCPTLLSAALSGLGVGYE